MLNKRDPAKHNNIKILTLNNALWNGGSRVVAIILNIVTVPIFLVELGDNEYGLYVLIQSLLSVLQLSSLGVGEATIKFMAESEGKNLRRETERYFRNGLFWFILAWVIGMSALLLSSKFLFSNILKITPIDQEIVRISINWFGIGWLFRNLNVGYWNIPITLQRYDILVLLRNGEVIVERLLGLVVVLMGGSIIGIFQVQLITLVATLFISAMVAGFLMPDIVLLPAFDSLAIRSTLKLGIWQSMASIGQNFKETVDRWIIGAILSPSVVGYFNAVMTIATSSEGFVSSLGVVLFPTFSYLQGQKRGEYANRIFVWGTWALGLVSAMILLPLVFLNTPFLTLWLGNEVDNWVFSLFVIVLVSRMINMPGILLPLYILSIGKTHWNAIVGIIHLIFVSFFTWFLLSKYGQSGLGWSYFFVGSITAIVLLLVRRRFFKEFPKFEYYSGIFSTPLLFLAGVVLIYFFLGQFPLTAIDNWPILLLVGSIISISTGTIIVLLSYSLPGRTIRSQIIMSVISKVWKGKQIQSKS